MFSTAVLLQSISLAAPMAAMVITARMKTLLHPPLKVKRFWRDIRPPSN